MPVGVRRMISQRSPLASKTWLRLCCHLAGPYVLSADRFSRGAQMSMKSAAGFASAGREFSLPTLRYSPPLGMVPLPRFASIAPEKVSCHTHTIRGSSQNLYSPAVAPPLRLRPHSPGHP